VKPESLDVEVHLKTNSNLFAGTLHNQMPSPVDVFPKKDEPASIDEMDYSFDQSSYKNMKYSLDKTSNDKMDYSLDPIIELLA